MRRSETKMLQTLDCGHDVGAERTRWQGHFADRTWSLGTLCDETNRVLAWQRHGEEENESDAAGAAHQRMA